MSAIEFGSAEQLIPPFDVAVQERIAARLLARLEAREPLVDLFDGYFEGRHQLSFVSGPYRRAFGQMLSGVCDNWMALVVNAAAERLEVQAFRVGDGADTDLNSRALDLWRREGLDLDAGLAFTEAAKAGEAYLLVTRDELTGITRMTVEHPAQFIVERDPADRRLITAALKAWWDDLYGEQHLTLWTRGGVYRLARRPQAAWFSERADGTAPAELNTLGVVPVAPLVNDPQMLPALPPNSLLLSPHNAPAVAVGLGRSDLADVIATQDAINQLASNMLLASEFAAFRQRWATGLEVPRDPDTGEPIEAYRAAVDRIWSSESPDTRFGEFAVTDLANYTGAIEFHIQSIASRTRIPPHILMSGSGNWPSGESLRAAESGLVSKVRDKMRSLGAAIGYAMALALSAELGADVGRVTVDWVDPERRIESEFVDSLVKKLAIGVPPQQLWEDYGYSPDQIAQFTRLLAEARDLNIIAAPSPAPAATTGGSSV